MKVDNSNTVAPLYETSLKSSIEGKSTQWAEPRGTYLLVIFFQEEMADVIICYSLAVANGLVEWSGTWKECD